MRLSMIGKHDDTFFLNILRVVTLDRVSIGENLNWQIVNFTNRLNFNFISPCAQFAFKPDVVFNWHSDEFLEIVFTQLNVVHCEGSNKFMLVFCPVKKN
jgi:hypothetical protein